MVRVRFFASYRELVGRDEVDLEVQGSMALEELLRKLEKEVPEAGRLFGDEKPIVAVDHEIAGKETEVGPEAEVAIFPPVSGGGGVRIQREDFDPGEEIACVRKSSSKIGGIAAFLGTAREFSRGRHVKKLVYEHYPGMAEKKLEELRSRAVKDFDIIDLSIVHRTGEIGINENIVLIIAAAVHREDAFKACEWCIDELKRIVPIWKKEVTTEGDVWIEEHP